jgi:DNA primase
LIIPFIFENRIVGYTARKLSEGKPKYISEQTPGYVFNLDAQTHIKWNDERYVLIVEGPMDALSTGGVAILGAEIMDKQAMLINKLGMTPVLVPDRDADGLRSIEQALANKWKVSLPNWHQDIKDANDAVRKYGRLWTLKSIIDGIETNELKVKLRMKQWVSLK